MQMEYVVLVNHQDEPHGTAEKLRVHQEGHLHRAISVCLVNGRGELLLQRRHPDKYHSGGLWSNTCCSHPRPGEDTAAAAHRRLYEEMGIRCDLHRAFGFTYRARLGDLVEHEYDHVFIGRYDHDPTPAPDEVNAWRWLALDALRTDMARRPETYTYWFHLMMDHLPPHLEGLDG